MLKELQILMEHNFSRKIYFIFFSVAIKSFSFEMFTKSETQQCFI